MELNRKPSDVALAAPASSDSSSNSLFKGDRQRNIRQAGGARSGRGGDQRPDEDKLRRLGPLQWIGIIGVHSHLFDNQARAASGAGAPWWRRPLTSPPGNRMTSRRNNVPCRAALATTGSTTMSTIARVAACTCRLGGHIHALHDQFQAGLHCILRDLPGVTSTADKCDIPTHASVDTGQAGAQREQGDIYLKLPENGHLASVIGHRELVLDVSRTHTHTKAGAPTGCRALKVRAGAKYRKHTQPYKATLPFS